MSMRTKLPAVAVSLVAALTLSACGGGTESLNSGNGKDGTSGPPPKDISTTLTVWSYNEPKDFPYITKWIDRFHESYPNVKVDWVWIEQQKLTSKLLGSAISGALPTASFQSRGRPSTRRRRHTP